jgi:hypothetical protein
MRAATATLLILAGCSSGKDLPPGAYMNSTFAFALVPPPGWTKVTTENAGEFIAANEKRLLTFMKEGMLNPVRGKTTWVVAFAKTDSTDPMIPVISVSHNSVGLPKVDIDVLKKSQATLKGKFVGSNYVNPKEEGAELVKVDGLASVRLTYTGGMEGFQVRCDEIMIASKTLTHFLSLTADQQGWDANLKTFEPVIASFRSFGGR